MKKRGSKKRNLTEGNIKKQLFQLTWPMLLGMLGMIVFNLVDTFYVGRLGVHELAAMSFTFPVVAIVNSLSRSIGIGTSSLISRNVIYAEHKEVRMMASRAIFLGFVLVLFFVVLGMLTIRPIFHAMGAEGEILDYVEDYMKIWYLGMPFVVMPMVGNSIVRATGDTFTPGMIILSNAIINVILDPLLIFGIGPFPELGIKGAALTTVISRSVGFVLILTVLIRREKLITFSLGKIRETIATWKSVLFIAAPTALTMLITPISVAIITKIIAGFGKEAVAGFGVASRVEMLALMVIMSLASVQIIFVGQNMSKQRYDRIKDALRLSSIFSMGWGTFVFLILLIFSHQIASLFSPDETVINVVHRFFLIVGVSYGFQGLVTLSTSSFNGLNKPYPSAVFSIVRMFVLYVPLAWLGAKLFQINGVFLAALIANVFVGIISYRYLLKVINRMEKKK